MRKKFRQRWASIRRRLLAMTAAVVTVTMAMGSPARAAGHAPDPTYVQPPGTAGLTTILGYGAWTVAFLCTVGILLVAGTMAVKHRRGEGGETLGALGWVLGACVLGAASGSIAGSLI
ncbi:hypothetical protein acdb102_21660 [Acidothermaceae bacterium B102]|nr:hypothetical protein acdb102_21660 [Acidothermaceae bacterium B102]